MLTESGSEYSTDKNPCNQLPQGRQLRRPFVFQALRGEPSTILYGVVFLALTLVLPVEAQSPWTAPDFEVIPKAPWEPGSYPTPGTPLMPLPKNDGLKKFAPPSVALKILSQNLSTSLKAAGQIYARIGLKEPITLRPEFNEHTRGAFLFPLGKFLGAYFPGGCHNDNSQHPYDESWLALNTNISGNDQYKTAAHELFHAIQDQYPWRKNPDGKLMICDVEKWVYEGMPDAVGFFLMEKKMRSLGLSLPNNGDNNYRKFYGIRPYDLPLHLKLASIPQIVKQRFDMQADGNKSVMTSFGYRTSSFWRFLMDRYRTISPVNQLKETRLLALSEGFLKRKGVASETMWLAWVEKGLKSSFFGYKGNPVPYFHFAYAGFLTEFAAWPGSKYKKLNFNDVEHDAFGGCEQVVLPDENQDTSRPFTLQARTPNGMALHPVAGRCIQVTVNGFKDKEITIKIEVETNSSTEAQQLLLGFARQEHEEGGVMKLDDDCYSRARQPSPRIKPFPCVYLGNIDDVTGTKKAKERTWRFGPTKVKHDNITMTYILSNVKPDEDASNTKGFKEVKGRIGFPWSKGHTDKGKLGSTPTSVTPDMIPDMSIPKRQMLYGIKKNSGFVTLFNPVNMGSFEVAALDESGNTIDVYSISAAQPVAFGQTGPFQAVIESKNGAPGSRYGATTLECFLGSEPNGNIIRSDDEVLTFKIDTPLCQSLTGNMADCQNGCPIVDHFQGELSLPFGYRYFSENQIEDVVTPGVLLDIDRYHYAVYGTPLQGLGGDDRSGSGGGPSGGTGGENSGDGSNGLGSETNSGIGEIPPCDCSCETYTKLNEAYDNLTASKDRMPDINALLQVAQCRQKCAAPFSECRRAKRRAEKNH